MTPMLLNLSQQTSIDWSENPFFTTEINVSALNVEIVKLDCCYLGEIMSFVIRRTFYSRVFSMFSLRRLWAKQVVLTMKGRHAVDAKRYCGILTAKNNFFKTEELKKRLKRKEQETIGHNKLWFFLRLFLSFSLLTCLHSSVPFSLSVSHSPSLSSSPFFF